MSYKFIRYYIYGYRTNVCANPNIVWRLSVVSRMSVVFCCLCIHTRARVTLCLSVSIMCHGLFRHMWLVGTSFMTSLWRNKTSSQDTGWCEQFFWNKCTRFWCICLILSFIYLARLVRCSLIAWCFVKLSESLLTPFSKKMLTFCCVWWSLS